MGRPRAAPARARAVEATDAAKFARMVVAANGFSDVIEVLQQKMEDVQLPEKVDVIVSEWMGYMLLRESMLDSVIVARDAWLKPGGALYPSKATCAPRLQARPCACALRGPPAAPLTASTLCAACLECRPRPLARCARRVYLAPIRTPLLQERSSQLSGALSEWASFAEYMASEHGIKVDCLNAAYAQEHTAYFLRTAHWKSLQADAVVGEACAWYSFDVATVTIEELKTRARGPFACAVSTAGPVHALAGWFDVVFGGSAQQPAQHPVVLSTAPDVGYTHWGQQVFLLSGKVFADRGDVLQGEGELTRQQSNERTLYMDLAVRLAPSRERGGALAQPGQKVRYAID